MEQKHPLQKIFTKRVTILILFAILIYISFAIVSNIFEYREYQQKLAKHNAEIDQLTRDNLQLTELMNFLNTDAAVDAYARTRLGLQAEGEKAFIITEEGIETTTRVDDLAVTIEPTTRKWYRYFFQ
jgi:cell division protein FtsB